MHHYLKYVVEYLMIPKDSLVSLKKQHKLQKSRRRIITLSELQRKKSGEG